MHFQIYNLPKKSYIIYTSKYIISLLNNISFNSKNIFLKTIDFSCPLCYNSHNENRGVNNEHNQTEKNIRIAYEVA